MILGVSQGFRKTLNLVGVGYRAAAKGKGPTEFEVFRADGQPHSLSSSDVTTIIEESPGVLWIGKKVKE